MMSDRGALHTISADWNTKYAVQSLHHKHQRGFLGDVAAVVSILTRRNGITPDAIPLMARGALIL
ncbi:hypothetical protein ACO03_19370 [Pantoea ananatis]|nr:hypothetical protein ACO03_20630 [Pantoea ananatis]CCF11960.1 hypothetical protein PANA5342_pPANA10229 [Pantoea ananatis LMG 5342]KNA26699.1 hypothetical protein ACO03_19370 [Pantoea ananatis]NQE77462.1 hypothetical protein [Pantoea ananatis]NQE82005.1 hypothetical protein [Pantoea ananatis]